MAMPWPTRQHEAPPDERATDAALAVAANAVVVVALALLLWWATLAT